MENILFVAVIVFLIIIAYNSLKSAQKDAYEKQQEIDIRAALRKEFYDKLRGLSFCDIPIDKEADKVRLDFGGYSVTTSRLRKNTKLSNIQDFVSIDVETTGLSPQKSEIISIAIVRFISLEPVEALYTYIKPSMSIPPEASEINGLTDADVENAPSFEQVRDAIVDFIGDYNIVAHNIMFDLRFLRHQGVDLEGSKRKYYDTLELSRLYDKDADNHKLITACRYNGIMLDSDAHTACADALACGLLFVKYVNDKVEPFEQ